MEKVTEILNSIKERLSNPLIFSFVVSWLVYNWEVTVALLWYDKSQIQACGCKSIFDFIADQVSKEGSFRYPLILAICYIVFMPFIKSGIKLFYVWISKFTDEKEIAILDGGKIGIDKYLDLRKDYKNKIKDLEDVANEEKKYLDENNKLLIEINDVKSNLNRSISDKNDLAKMYNEIGDLSFLNGFWKCKLTINNNSGFDNEKLEHDVEIENGKYKVFKGEKVEYMYDIRNFFLDRKRNIIFFIKYIEDNYRKKINNEDDDEISANYYKINDLRIENEDLLTGFENRYVEVRYERITKRTSDQTNSDIKKDL